MRTKWVGAFGLGLGMAVSLAAQQASQPAPAAQDDSPRHTLIPRTHEQRENSYHAQHRIILNAQVLDGSGKPAAGLTASDFILLDNQQPRKIASFHASGVVTENQRGHVLIVLDTVNNSARTLGVERKELERFLERSRGRIRVPISLVVLSERGASVGNPSRDADVLLAGLKQSEVDLHAMDCNEGGAVLAAPHAGSYSPGLDLSPRESVKERQQKADCLNQRFTVSLSALNKLAKEQVNVPGRAIVIWLGEGWPLLLGPEFAPETPAETRNYFDYLADLSASLREGQVTLDAVSSPDLFRKAEAGEEKLSSVPPPDTDVAHTGDFALPLLVRQTGGQVLEYDKDLAGEIAACVTDAESYYVLAFDSPPAAGVGQYRTLEVKVSKPGLTVRTNAAYFAQP